MEFGAIKQQIREALRERNIPSLAIAVTKDGETIWEDGFWLGES